MSIFLYFHLMRHRDFKYFYFFYVCQHMRIELPRLVSYNRFVELMDKTLLPLAFSPKTRCFDNCTVISYVNSTPLRACHIKRAHSNMVLKGLATKCQCIIGWLSGLKLHFVINDKGGMLNFIFTPGNVDDIQPLTGRNLRASIYGKLFVDKEYISQSMFENSS